MTQDRTALVLGATGGIGGHLAARLLEQGWSVRALTRDPHRARRRVKGPIDWRGGDALDRNAVREAARGTRLIAHAVNPPGYRNWGTVVLPMIDNTIAAARAADARILLPGTIYNYGPDAFPVLREDSPQHPRSRKGAIRVELERRLAASGVRALIVRAGDFFGPGAGGSWFSQGLVRPGRPVRTIRDPGTPGTGHSWAYLPDLAACMVALVEREADLASFDRFHFAGHWDPDGSAVTSAIARATGAQVRRFPWWLVRVASPVVPVFRELAEMRHLWREPLRLDNARLLRMLGSEPRTPLDDAVRDTLAALGCAPAPRREVHEPGRHAGPGSLGPGGETDLRAGRRAGNHA